MKNLWTLASGFGWLAAFVVMVVMFGCATPDSAITKKYEISQKTRTGDNVLILKIDADVKSSSSVKQDAKADPATQIDTALSPASKINDGVDTVKSLLGIGSNSKTLDVKNHIEDVAAKKDITMTYDMKWLPEHNRAFVWLPATGADYGGPIQLTFDNDCGGLLVRDASDNADFKDGQGLYFCGTKNAAAESNGDRASVFGPVGCKATKVTISSIDDEKNIHEKGKYHGLTNGNRPTWYFSKRMNEYPSTFDITIPGCNTINVKNNGVRDDHHDGYLVKQSDVKGRGMVVLANKDCNSTIAEFWHQLASK